MTRFARLWVWLGAFAILASLPGGASAGWLLGRHDDSGSYSCLHYWLPSLYTYRAYHRPGNFNDQAQYDMGETDVISTEPGPASKPELLPPPKKEAELAPLPKKATGKKLSKKIPSSAVSI